MFNCLPDDKILHLFKLKTSADDKLKLPNKEINEFLLTEYTPAIPRCRDKNKPSQETGNR